MKHVNLDSHDEAVKRFVLQLAAEPEGSLLEIGGRVVARVLPPPAGGGGGDSDGGAWTDAKNARRCELVDREIAGALSPDEATELERLQEAMLRHRRQVAPLPLEDARRLHRELLTRAQAGPADAGA